MYRLLGLNPASSQFITIFLVSTKFLWTQIMTLTCFKAYDIRGKLGSELNEDIAYRIGRAYADHLDAKRVVVGGDVRLTSEPLKQALANGLMDSGADVIDIGMVGTEEIYFAAFHLDVDGGIEVTASHNPMDYNGMKLVRKGARPISGDTGLKTIQTLAEARQFKTSGKRGCLTRQSILAAYVDHLLTYIDLASYKAPQTCRQCRKRCSRACDRCHRRKIWATGRTGELY